MGRLRDNGITAGKPAPQILLAGVSRLSAEGLVCPPRHPRLSPTRTLICPPRDPHLSPTGTSWGDTGDADARFVKIFINPKDINQADMKRTLLTLTLLLALAAGTPRNPLPSPGKPAGTWRSATAKTSGGRTTPSARPSWTSKSPLPPTCPQLDATGTGAYVGDLDMMGMQLQMRGMYMAGLP